MYFVLIQFLLLLEGAVAQQTGTINDIEHIVVFMQVGHSSLPSNLFKDT